MQKLNKIGKRLFNIYVGIGVVGIGLMACVTIFAVIMRYFFSLNWKGLSEFNVTLFAFTTFWAMGINVIKDEHVIIDFFIDRIKPTIKRWVSVFNYAVVLIVDLVFAYYSYIYMFKAGKQISQGMEIPMYYMYGIMPVSAVICAVCIIVKIVGFINAPLETFAPRNVLADEQKEEVN